MPRAVRLQRYGFGGASYLDQQVAHQQHLVNRQQRIARYARQILRQNTHSPQFVQRLQRENARDPNFQRDLNEMIRQGTPQDPFAAAAKGVGRMVGGTYHRLWTLGTAPIQAMIEHPGSHQAMVEARHRQFRAGQQELEAETAYHEVLHIRHHPIAGSLALAAIGPLRLTRAAGEVYMAAREGEPAIAAGVRSYKAGEGLLRPALAAARRNLTPELRALARSPGRRDIFDQIDATIHDPEQNAAAKRYADQQILNHAKALKRRASEGWAGLVPHEPDLAPELHPQALYQHVPPDLSGAEAMPARLRIKGLNARTYKLIRQGAEYRNWYRRGSIVIRDFGERLGLTDKQAAGIVAITSQGSNPTYNLRRAAEFVNAARAGVRIPDMSGQYDKVFQIVHDPEAFDWQGFHRGDYGPKVSNYFANFYRHLNPEDYKAIFGADARHATIDRHMIAMLMGKKGTISDKQYESLKQVVFKTADALGWSPEEVQAAAWVPWKAQQMGVTQQVKAFLREADKAGTLPEELRIPDRLKGKKLTKEAKALHGARAAWAREQLTGTIPPGWEKHLPTASDAYERGQELYRAPSMEHVGTGDWLYQRGERGAASEHTFDSGVAQVHSEIRPDERFWPERAAAFDRMSPEERIQYAKLTDQAIGHEFEDALGLKAGGKHSGHGIWRGRYAPGVAHHVLLDGGEVTGSEAELNALAAATGMAKHQTSVSWGVPLEAGRGAYGGIHWIPPEGADPARLSAAMDTVAGEGNVGFIHAPDGGYYVIDFQGRFASRASTDVAMHNLGGEQTAIGWDGGYAIDARIAREDDWGHRYQAAIEALPQHQRSSLDLAMTRVRARTDQIDEHFLGRQGARLVDFEEAKALEAQGTHVFHGSPVADQIMAERRLRVGQEAPIAAWTTTHPEYADFFAPEGGRNIVAIPKDQIPFGEGYAQHPFGAYGSPHDILFQREAGKYDHLSLDELHARHHELGQRYESLVDELAKGEGVPGDYKRLTAYQNATARKTMRRLGRRAPTVKEMLRDRAETKLLRLLETHPHLPQVQELQREIDEHWNLTREIHRRNDELFQEPVPGDVKGVFRRLGRRGQITLVPGKADVGTLAHEFAHFIRNAGLPPEVEEVLSKGSGARKLPDGSWSWSTQAEENFANKVLAFIHSPNPPRNLVDTFETMAQGMEKAGYKVEDLPKNSAEEEDALRTLFGHENSNALAQTVLRRSRAFAQAAGVAGKYQKGPPRTDPEELQAHLDDAIARARAEGFGIQEKDIGKLKAGQQPEEFGGAPGEAVRATIAGRVLGKEEMGAYERAGAGLDVRSARQARAEQEALRTRQRGKRTGASAAAFEGAGGGLKGYYAGMHELQGKYAAVDLGQIPGLNSDAVDFLMNYAEHHPALADKVFLRRRAQTALLKIINGEGIQHNEERLLGRLFGREMRPATLRATVGAMSKMDILREMVNLPRSFMATLDQSAMFRHGIMTLAHSPRIWARQFGPMYKALFSERSAQQWKEALQAFETYPLADKGGVQFTSLASDLSQREEQYMSVLAERIPGIGRIVKASDRSYVGVLNAMRMGLFDKLVRQAAAEGWNVNDEHLLQSIGKFVNSASGRGDLGALKKHAITLQTLLFSPRLLASRINFMSPVFYHSLHPFARRQALLGLRNLTAMALTVLGAAKLAGAQVVLDPRSADFGKIKVGNTRVDFLGGFQQPIVLLSTLLSGTRISSTTGLPEKLSGGAYGTSRFDVLWRFFQNKMAPVPGGMTELLQGQDPQTHEPLGMKQLGLPGLRHPLRAIEENFYLHHTMPLLAQDIASLPGTEKAYMAPFGALGISTQSYGAPPKGQHYQSKISEDSVKAGMGKPPQVVLRDAQWKGELDNKITPGMSSYDKMKAAAEVFDQRYGSNVAPQLERTVTTEGGAQKVYEELRSRISPVYDHWKTAVDRSLNAQQGAKPVEHKSGGGVIHTIEHGLGSVAHDIGGLVGAAPASAATMPRHPSGLPHELASAIESAAQRYHVPADTLAGIWRIESGSTFPNPAVNSSGYGGLFGTTKWNASTREQADYAAQTLRHLLDTHGGSMAQALHAYSGGGYTSVPGAGGAWHAGGGGAGMAPGGPQIAPAAMGGFGGAGGSRMSAVMHQALQDLAQGSYNPVQTLTSVLHSLGDQPLQGNVQGINFQLPKGGKAAGAARGAIALAEHYLGTPYVWGGESPRGFDCSGLLQFVWGRMGVHIPRTSQLQWRAGRPVGKGALRPGDAVFFEPTASGPGHVGMYIGGGRFIEAPHTGATVRISNLRGYPGYMGARRFR